MATCRWRCARCRPVPSTSSRSPSTTRTCSTACSAPSPTTPSQRERDTQRAQLRALFASLTPREREVLDLVVEGMSNKAVANALGLSAKTVEVHRAKVMEKMHARSVSDLVKMAMQNQAP
jgi:RNA polymerase sigma factor (sigma-70 family)